MLLSTHDLSLAETLCTRAIILDAGCVVADVPLEELLADDAILQEHGLR
jgi:cobalt/nickel transport system ATP-binding protein